MKLLLIVILFIILGEAVTCLMTRQDMYEKRERVKKEMEDRIKMDYANEVKKEWDAVQSCIDTNRLTYDLFLNNVEQLLLSSESEDVRVDNFPISDHHCVAHFMVELIDKGYNFDYDDEDKVFVISITPSYASVIGVGLRRQQCWNVDVCPREEIFVLPCYDYKNVEAVKKFVSDFLMNLNKK